VKRIRDLFKFKSTKARENRGELIKRLREVGLEVFEYTRSPRQLAERNEIIGQAVSEGVSFAIRESSDLDIDLWVFAGKKPVGEIGVSHREVNIRFYWDKLDPDSDSSYLNERTLKDEEAKIFIAFAKELDLGIWSGLGPGRPKWMLEPEGTFKEYNDQYT